jgi:broad specificity phosphatase PhoE
MKWPHTLTFIRHGESAYNELKEKKRIHADYDRFCTVFDRDFAHAKDEAWPSEELKELAEKIWHETTLSMSDYDTPLTRAGLLQAKKVGKKLESSIPFPSVIYVSPYVRTRQTFEAIRGEWKELAKVKTVYEERIREQEHGLATVFNDWRVYNVKNPLQALLYKMEGGYEYRFLNGESKADVRDRVRDFLGTLVREHAEEHVLVISHHLTILSFRANLEHWDRDQFITTDKNEAPINCGITMYQGHPELGKEGKLLLDIYNKKLY